MDQFLDLKRTEVFKDANELECQAMMFCFKTKFKNYEKNQYIVSQGDDMEYVVLLLKGSCNVENVDTLGNISILTKMKRGDIYGLEATYAGDETYKDSLIATEKCTVLFLNKFKLTHPCTNHCKRHEQVIKNTTKMLADRSIELLEKLTHLSQKTTRDKLLSYLSMMSKKANSPYFEIPFNKTELANYLSVDRSAMSTELSKMRDEGIVDFDKKQYRLILKEEK